MEKLGLIAGNRRYPLIFAEQARRRGSYVVAIAIKGNTSAKINTYAHRVYWIDIKEFSKMYEIFRQEGIKDVTMAGQINPAYLFNKKVMESYDIKTLFDGLEDRRANSIFGLIAQKLNDQGFKLSDSTIFMEDYLPAKGVLTNLEPDNAVQKDIDFGLGIAKKIAALDIGLSVAVKSGSIVAVEALEGTDSLIRRAGRISRKGAVIIKVSRPNQDMRFDLPLVGLTTVKNLIKVKAACLAIEAKKTLFIDKTEGIRLADRHGLSIVAV